MDYALVTGSTSGIGLAIAKKLLSEGLFVYINYSHDEMRANAAITELSSISPNCEAIRADLSSYGGADTLIQTIQDKGITLKYLVLNCGMTDRTPFGEVTPDSWDAVMNANINVPFFLLQGLHDNLADGGAVIGISSLMAAYPHSVSVSYGVSKAAMSALCRNMVKIYAAKQIRINALEPGFIETPWHQEKPDELRKCISSKIALGHFGRPEDIADMCWGVLQNGYVNGAVIPVCGGYCMQ